MSTVDIRGVEITPPHRKLGRRLYAPSTPITLSVEEFQTDYPTPADSGFAQLRYEG